MANSNDILGTGPNKETWSEEMDRINPIHGEGMEKTLDTDTPTPGMMG